MQLKDQMGRLLTFEEPPKRIVSLVPSLSELIWDMNLNTELTGVTKFCVHPELLRKEKVVVGGTKNVKADRIFSLNPELVIANQEENSREEIASIAKFFPTYISDVKNIEDLLKLIQDIGMICNRKREARDLAVKINNSLPHNVEKKKSAIYLIWNEPYMSVGGDTFISHIMNRVGFENCLKSKERYPLLTKGEIISTSPDELLLSSEPFPFKETHLKTLQEQFPTIKVRLVDGEAFSWYGSRIYKVKEYLNSLL